MRVLHTADWHLGHSLHGASRDFEHARFMGWLLDTVAERQVDALLICGDIFDSANPPVRALRAWYEFLAAARRRCPALDIVAIGGNHDSAARLEAPNPVLDAFGIHVVGGPPRTAAGLDVDALLVPLTAGGTEPLAWVVAMPFLRPADLPRVEEAADELVEGVRAAYAAALAEARTRAAAADTAPVPVLVMGHLYLAATQVSELSERKVLGGNQHALPADIFGAGTTYGALGHLHLAQAVGEHEHIRYSGSPIPLSLAERTYDHQVVLVELDGAQLLRIEPLSVPRAVELLRVPETGALEPDAALARLAELEAVAGADGEPRPFLEVAVTLSAPRPGLRRDVETAVEGKGYYLAKITTEYTGSGYALGDVEVESRLDELTVEEVFERLWARDHEGAPPPVLLEALAELRDAAEHAEEGP